MSWQCPYEVWIQRYSKILKFGNNLDLKMSVLVCCLVVVKNMPFVLFILRERHD